MRRDEVQGLSQERAEGMFRRARRGRALRACMRYGTAGDEGDLVMRPRAASSSTSSIRESRR